MLISSYQERYARSTEKIRVLLNFLKEETYSDFQIIKLLLILNLTALSTGCWRRWRKWG